MPAPGPPDVEPAIADMGADVDVVGVVIVDGGMTGGVVEGKMTAGPREPRTASVSVFRFTLNALHSFLCLDQCSFWQALPQ